MPEQAAQHHRIDRRAFLSAAAVGVAGTAMWPRRAAGADFKGSGSIVVYDGGGAWGAAQRAAYFEPFEAVSGIKVVPSPAAPATKIRAGAKVGAPGFDVVEMSAARIDTFIREGLKDKASSPPHCKHKCLGKRPLFWGQR